MLHRMFVILMTLGAAGPAGAKTQAALEFIPVTLGVGQDARCIPFEGSCYLPSTPDANVVVKNAKVSVLRDEERSLSIELDPADGSLLRNLTATHVGEHLAVMVEGQVVFTGLIREKLESGTLKISVNDQKAYEQLIESLDAQP